MTNDDEGEGGRGGNDTPKNDDVIYEDTKSNNNPRDFYLFV